MAAIKGSLLWKLVAINLPVVVVVIAVIWLTVDTLAAGYFTTLMTEYNINPTRSHQMFLDSVHRYMIQASLAALAIAGALSYVLTKRALRPLAQMADAARRIAGGDYSARIQVTSQDEIGDLGGAFNQMTESLERIEKLRKTMVSDMAHELRTPLTNIRGYLEGLSDGIVSPSRNTHDILEQEILRLVRLVEDFQQLTKADAARAHLRREKLSLPDLVDQVVGLNRHEFATRGITVATSFHDPASPIDADRDKLIQVLSNLIQNAWQ